MSKICPMASMQSCIEEKCGFWDKDSECCAILSLVNHLDHLTEVIRWKP